jgi:hypothetical protein
MWHKEVKLLGEERKKRGEERRGEERGAVRRGVGGERRGKREEGRGEERGAERRGREEERRGKRDEGRGGERSGEEKGEDLIHSSEFKVATKMFRKPDLFTSSGEESETYFVGSLRERANVSHWTKGPNRVGA